MNITLRKANAVQNSIQEAIKSIKIETAININEFQDPEVELQKANDLLFSSDRRRQALLLAYYNIRGLVGAANAQNGIDVNLTKAAFIDKRIAQLTEIANADPYTSVEIIKGRLDKIKNSDNKSRIYGYEDHVTTTVIATEQIDQAKTEIQNLKKQKQKINDEVLEANIKTEIPLSDDVVATLQAEGLI
jgi:hypothetical protein